MHKFKVGEKVKYSSSYKRLNREVLPWANVIYEITRIYDKKIFTSLYDLKYIDNNGNTIHVDKISERYIESQ